MGKPINEPYMQSNQDNKRFKKTIEVFENANGNLNDLLEAFPRFS